MSGCWSWATACASRWNRVELFRRRMGPGQHHLQRHDAVELDVPCLVDDPHAPATDLVEDHVARQGDAGPMAGAVALAGVPRIRNGIRPRVDVPGGIRRGPVRARRSGESEARVAGHPHAGWINPGAEFGRLARRGNRATGGRRGSQRRQGGWAIRPAAGSPRGSDQGPRSRATSRRQAARRARA